MRTVNWGIIGCGDVADKKSGPAFSSVRNSQLIAVMRRDPARAEEFACRHNVAHSYSTTEDLLNNNSINAIYVASPPSSHKEHAIQALRKGFNVYLEKPVGLNAMEAKDIYAELLSSGAKLCVAHYRRYLPLFTHVKYLLMTSHIGEVRSCHVKLWQSIPKTTAADNWRLDPSVSGGGLFHDLAPHQLDIMLYLFGKPVWYRGMGLSQASGSDVTGECYPADHVCGMALFPEQLVFNGSWCFCVDESNVTDECIILGSRGSIQFSFFGPSCTLVVRSRGPASSSNATTCSCEDADDLGTLEVTSQIFEHPTVIQTPMIESVVEYFLQETYSRGNGTPTVEGEGLHNPCSLEDAIVVMEMMDAFSTPI